MNYQSLDDSIFLQSLRQRADLTKYGNLAQVFLALELFADIEDIHSVASNATTEGSDDENIDVLYTDRDRGQIIAVQAYCSTKIRERAQLSKAQESSYAVDALFSANLTSLPLRIRAQIEEARAAIRDGDIRSIHIWFLHNCPEHLDSRRVLNTIGQSATRQLRHCYPDKHINVDARELGLESLDELYRTQLDAILVTDRIDVEGLPGFVEEGEGWQAFVTSISGCQLVGIYRQYGEDLFSANVRSYLGSNYKDKVINKQIVDSAKNNPGEFFICNNGITALVHDFTAERIEGTHLAILSSVNGLSIVNGAQTTGCLVEADNIDRTIKVNIRFIRVSDSDQVKRVTKATNSQNKILASDFRSGDPIQTRLRERFQEVRGALYTGGLRRNLSAAEKRELLPTETVAQVLMAFHGHPTNSYHDKSRIWESDELYGIAFASTITPAHIVFVYTLYEAINTTKKEYSDKLKRNELLPQDEPIFALLSMPGVSFLIVHAISKILESIIGRPISDRYAVCFKSGTGRTQAVSLWKPIVSRVIRRTSRLEPAARGRLSRRSEIDAAMAAFIEDMDMNREEFPDWFSDFIGSVMI